MNLSLPHILHVKQPGLGSYLLTSKYCCFLELRFYECCHSCFLYKSIPLSVLNPSKTSTVVSHSQFGNTITSPLKKRKIRNWFMFLLACFLFNLGVFFSLNQIKSSLQPEKILRMPKKTKKIFKLNLLDFCLEKF